MDETPCLQQGDDNLTDPSSGDITPNGLPSSGSCSSNQGPICERGSGHVGQSTQLQAELSPLLPGGSKLHSLGEVLTSHDSTSNRLCCNIDVYGDITVRPGIFRECEETFVVLRLGRLRPRGVKYGGGTS